MSEASRQRLLDEAEVYALHAMSESERRAIESERIRVDETTRAQFDILVGEIHETLALAAAAARLPHPNACGRPC